MTELRFKTDLYSGFAIDSAVKVYGEYADFDLEKTDEEYIVRFTPTGDFPADAIADELGNYALGATVEERGTEK